MESLTSQAAEHQSLLQELGELDYAQSALEQAQTRIETLEGELKAQQSALDEVTRRTRKEYDDWQKWQNKRLRRAALRVKGKDELEARVEKEEREWLDALKEEGRQKDKISTTQTELAEMHTLVLNLKAMSAKHAEVQKRLDLMYERVFAGPSEQFPEEDNAESDVYALEKEYKEAQTRINNSAQSINLLAKVDENLVHCVNEMEQAYRSLDTPLFFRGSFSDLMERNLIEKSAVHASRAASFYVEARTYDKELPDSLDMPNLIRLANTYFDNRFMISTIDTVAMLTQSVDTAKRAVRMSLARLRHEFKQSQQRNRQAEAQSKNTHMRLRRARAHLDSTRRAIMVDLHTNAASGNFVEEPESFDDGDARLSTSSENNNPYAAFLLRRATTIDHGTEAPPAYIPRTKDYE